MVEALGCLVELLLDVVRAAPKMDAWLRRLKTENPKWYWVVIGVGCWTLFVAAAPCLVSTVWTALDVSQAQLPPPSLGDWMEAFMYFGFCLSLPALVVLALPAWAVVAFLLLARRVSVRPEALADLVARPKGYADFSPMPETFAQFARMLEEAKANSGTLICFECGHHNPVGRTQCQECGAWVPQTAKARWAYRPRTTELQDTTGQAAEPPVCPQCGKADHVQKMSEIPDWPAEYGPPDKPRSIELLDAVLLALAALWVALDATFIVVMAIAHQWELVLAGLFLFAFVPLAVGAPRLTLRHRQKEQWEKGVSRWERLYFCPRDELAFIPGGARAIPLHEVRDLLCAGEVQWAGFAPKPPNESAAERREP